jgi:hypothetical protein
VRPQYVEWISLSATTVAHQRGCSQVRARVPTPGVVLSDYFHIAVVITGVIPAFTFIQFGRLRADMVNITVVITINSS